MESLQQIRSDLEASTLALETALAGCSEERFNMRPIDGGWTAGEIIEHLLLVETMLNQRFGGVSNVTEREIDKKVQIVKNVFGDAGQQYNSPAVFVPSTNEKNKTELLEKLVAERKQLSVMASQFDLTQTLLYFKHPYLGAFTRYEWIYFVIHHSNRHLLQLQRVLAEVIDLNLNFSLG